MMKDGSRIEYFYNGDSLEYELFFSASGTLTRLHKYIYNADGDVEFMITKTDKFNNPNLYNAYSYIRNAQNDVVALVRVIRDTGTKLETGRELVATYTYSPYGELIESASHGFDSQTHLYNPFRYRGYYYDRETGLYYLQSRYYDAKVGRFLNADVFSSTGQGLNGTNMFAYCGNNPVMRLDPSGHFWKSVRSFFTKVFTKVTNFVSSLFGVEYKEIAQTPTVKGTIAVPSKYSPVKVQYKGNASNVYNKKGKKKKITAYAHNVNCNFAESKAGIEFNNGNAHSKIQVGINDTSIALGYKNFDVSLTLSFDTLDLSLSVNKVTEIDEYNSVNESYSASINGYFIVYAVSILSGMQAPTPQLNPSYAT